jgi:hypothetical protein
MSADNGVYIAKFDSGVYRVAYAQAIENVYENADDKEAAKAMHSLYFGDSPIFTECKLAVDYANQLADTYEYLEYGVVTLNDITLIEFDEDIINAANLLNSTINEKNKDKKVLMGYYLYNDGHNNHLIKLNGKTIATLNQLNANYDLIEIAKLLELANEAIAVDGVIKKFREDEVNFLHNF